MIVRGIPQEAGRFFGGTWLVYRCLRHKDFTVQPTRLELLDGEVFHGSRSLSTPTQQLDDEVVPLIS